VITLAVTDAPTDAEREAVRSGLRAHNAITVGPDGFATQPLAVFAYDAEGRVVGGLLGLTLHRCLFVDQLQVDAAQRGVGLGTRLLDAAEAAARARGCIGVRLDTYSFQAPGFYAKRGYAVLAALEDCLPGHSRYFLFKRLDGDTPCST